MLRLENNNVYEFNSDTLNEVRKLYNLDKPGAMDDAIDILDQWIKKQHHFIKKDYDRKYLERAIIGNKGSIERTKTRFDRTCTLKTLNPQLFGDFDIKKDFKEFEEFLQQIPLPKMTEDHHRITILKNYGKKFEPTFAMNYFRMAYMIIEHFKLHDYAAGYIIVIDYTHANIVNLALSFNPVELQQFMSIITEAYGLRVKAMHIISDSKMVDTIVSLFKKVFSKKIGDRIVVHKDYESLYKCVPKHLLPNDYGGDLDSFNEIHERWLEELSSNKTRDFMKEISNAKTNESLRLKDSFNDQYIGMPGTFRTLSVD